MRRAIGSQTCPWRVNYSAQMNTRVSATYRLAFLRVHPNGSWTSGLADVSLEIEMTPQGPRIVKQNSTTRDDAKRRGDRNPPNL